jgi:hypothetical protein
MKYYNEPYAFEIYSCLQGEYRMELCNQRTGQFISPSGTSELGSATTKTDTAERSIAIGSKSLHVCFVKRRQGVFAGFTARGQS